VGVPGTGLSYNTGGAKAQNPADASSTIPNAKILKREQALENKEGKRRIQQRLEGIYWRT